MTLDDLSRTPLHGTHISLGGRMVPFAAWDMPVQYTGILEEARAVRTKAGIFDVSHMGRLYISGSQAGDLLDWVVTANAADLRLGRARYAMICNESGGIIDDTVFYRLGQDEYLLVCNAGNRQNVVPWINRWVQEKYIGTQVDDRTVATAMIAFQGPATAGALDLLSDGAASQIRPFSSIEGRVDSMQALICRTGYTGEDGFELIVEAVDAPAIWAALMEAGGVPCGLGSRDVLRLEAGMALHGHEISLSTTPLEAGLERYVRLEKEFVGSDVLKRQSIEGTTRRLVGLVVEGRSLPREGHPVHVDGNQIGQVTSGGISPTLDRNIGMAYVLKEFSTPGQKIQVDIRGRLAEGAVVPLPFYSRKGAG